MTTRTGDDKMLTKGDPIAGQALRILCVDDHTLMREGIKSVIGGEPDMEVIAEACDGQAAVELCLNIRPDVTLMDIRMPVMNGIDATIAIRKAWPAARIIIVTTCSGDVQSLRALSAGARGFLLKSSLRLELIHAIRTVAAGGTVGPVESTPGADKAPKGALLTNNELAVLRLIAVGKLQREVAVALGMTNSIVKSHIRSVVSKLGARDKTHAVTLGLQSGLLDA